MESIHIGPTFRAENFNTKRHVAEFWQIELEVAFADLNDIIKLTILIYNDIIHSIQMKINRSKI